ncbi:MAG: zinc-ribbon domain-containing protein [Promethearchaeota archaeon]
MSLKCYYHSDRDAQSKCDKCGKLICLECKKAFTATHGVNKSQYATRHELCLLCYFDREMASIRSSSTTCLVFIVFAIIMTTVFSFTNQRFIFVPIIIGSIAIIISIILYYHTKYIWGPRKAETISIQRQKFMDSLKISKEKQGIKPINSEIYCSKCGNKIEEKVSICPHCGNNIPINFK